MNVQRPAHSADATTVEDALAAGNYDPVIDSKTATDVALQNTLLTPRFYTTDFDEMDAIDVTPVREEWDKLIAAMKADPNKGHFKKNEDWDDIDWDGMEPRLKAEFIDFLISSCTADFSGCVLYKEMKRRGSNSDITTLFQLMARDEARHAGFINAALGLIGLGPLEMLQTDFAVYMGIVTGYLPLMILPLYATLEKLDGSLEEAAHDLGAPPWRTFLTVTLPLSLPGIVAGCMLVFIPAIGEYVIPALLGGPDTLMIGRVLWDEFFSNRDWPVASAVAIAMLALIVGPVLWLQKSMERG